MNAKEEMKNQEKTISQEKKQKSTSYHNRPVGKPFKVLYHDDWDGIAAAWVVKKALEVPFESTSAKNLRLVTWSLEDTEFIPVQYGFDPPENLENSDVLILDFSYKRPMMEELKEKTKVLICLDHHAKAADELKDLDYCIFDNNKAGCLLAWEFFHGPAKEPPLFLKYVDDRDRWKFVLEDSKELNAVIHSYPMTFESCDELHHTFKLCEMSSLLYTATVLEGIGILRFQQRMIEDSVKHAKPMMIMGHVGLGVNMPNQNMISMVGEALCEERFTKENGNDSMSSRPAFGVCWFHNGKEWVYSLRSRYGFDVSELAAQLGGGGHKGAAGFQSDMVPWYYEGVFHETPLSQIKESIKKDVAPF